jgi:hypothetical protein
MMTGAASLSANSISITPGLKPFRLPEKAAERKLYPAQHKLNG